MSGTGPRPVWLRPSALAIVVLAHVGALFVRAEETVTPGRGPIEIAIVSEPEPNPEARSEPTPEVLPNEASSAREATPEPSPTPSVPVEETATAEDIPEPEPTLEPTPPEPVATTATVPLPPPPEARPAIVREDRRDKPVKRRKVETSERRREASIDAAARESKRATDGAARRAAAASYASLVAGEIRRHRHYPTSAREADVIGVVGVAFTVGPGGTIVSHSITRSSGSGALDGAVHGMMRAVRLPPPPGGVFRSSISIRFETR